jgi:hypothetical protein
LQVLGMCVSLCLVEVDSLLRFLKKTKNGDEVFYKNRHNYNLWV